MTDKNKSKIHEIDTSAEHDALWAFERMLEIMPDDRSALEAAIFAGQAAGEREKALVYRLRLVDILLEEGDESSLKEHVAALREDPDPRASEWIEKYDLGSSSKKTAQAEEAAEAPLQEKAAAPIYTETKNIAEEIDLAWKLLENEEITREEYAEMVRNLTEMLASEDGGTVTALHSLEASNHRKLEQILSFLSQSSRTPYISLSSFTIRPEMASILPDDFITNRGAIAFDTIGRELMIAILNPFSRSLRTDVKNVSGAHCHFYLTRASEFDDAHQRLRTSASQS